MVLYSLWFLLIWFNAVLPWWVIMPVGAYLLAFLLHTPGGESPLCVACGQKWPCDHVCLAFRLREGF